ncbi:putative monovalent cation/H+ antiporter subunit A [Jannaschia ovalis]|uniref:Monovalent cation/H+ antiporter subunit A n=1 Tax=Jannaschia ovalis TaxID=3038773 RepID=A0ABY8L896_9RHOB|nr:putative monovalent cation/H+ antiporter subunit A [Jannaschia sp. GRR-S6-38]WGH77589.1 putative monovalent cation/H+ antiporter subunit A [Jannaschia sp. GRR-S6-38]
MAEASNRVLGGPAGVISVLVPLGLFAWLLQFVPAVAAGEVLLWRLDWAPSLGVTLGILLDGLSLSFALLITGIGALVTLYSTRYLGGHPHYTRFVIYLLGFMGGMLGLVLSDNLLALFVFWEITTITSYLLIGFDADQAKARRNALQALLVTGIGGLAFLAGIVLIGTAAGTFEISEIEGSLTGHALYLPIFLLVVAGAFTKSAQVPFHFWLPNAMAAPTPVSAYLHSATMVKGGVYLLARMNPSLGGSEIWFWTLILFGGVTAVFASVLAIRQTDIKQVLAYTTLMALGTLVMFIGLGTAAAIEAAMTFLLVHSFYKAALFLMIGVVDHGTGTRDATILRGLARAMPLTALAAALAALSMAGLPPLFGFIGKEFMYKAALDAPVAVWWVTGCAFAASALMFAAGGIVAWRPFTGKLAATPVTPHEGPWPMLAGPLLLAALGVAAGLMPDHAELLVAPATAAVLGAPAEVDLYLFKEVNAAFILSLLTFALGFVIYLVHAPMRARLAQVPARFDPGWDRLMDGVSDGSKGLTGLIQTGRLRRYVFVTFATLAAVLAWAIWRGGVLPDLPPLEDLRAKHWSVLIFILVGALLTAATNSRMTAVAALGTVGIGVALIFIMFGAPDVAITQLLVEVLQVVLVAVAMLKLPRMKIENVSRLRGWDMALALSLGALTSLVLLAVMQAPLDLRLTAFFEATSAPIAHGRNIVNVILVDFRALDTFGEIAVVAIAALGAYALLRGTRRARP